MNTNKNTKIKPLFWLTAVMLALLIFMPAKTDAAYPIVGTSNTDFATGVPKDRHMIVFDQFVVEAHLENYDNTGKGVLKFRKSSDGYAWVDAIANPTATITSGKFFFISRDMTGNTNCSSAEYCNIYLVYSRNNATEPCATVLAGDSGGIYFRELTYDQNTQLWTIQNEVQVNDPTKWWDKYQSWRHTNAVCFPGPVSQRSNPEFDNEPKPQIWVEGSRAMVLYDMSTTRNAKGFDSISFEPCPAPPFDPSTFISGDCWDGTDYTYLRTRSLTRTGGAWAVDSGTVRDIGAVQNCVNVAGPGTFDPYDNIEMEAYMYAALTKNPITKQFEVVYNRSPRQGDCALTSNGRTVPSTWETGQILPGEVRIGVIQSDALGATNFSWGPCARNPEAITYPQATPPQITCAPRPFENENPGANFSVSSVDAIDGICNNGPADLCAIRVTYPFSFGTKVRLAEYRQKNASGTFDWTTQTGAIRLYDLSAASTGNFGTQNIIVPTIMSDGNDYWIVAYYRSGASGNDYQIRYRRMRLNTTDSNPENWTHERYGDPLDLNEGAGIIADRFPTAPYRNLAGYLTSVGHPPFIWTTWSNGGAAPFNLLYPEDSTGVRVNGWGWSPNIGWISLDYRNTGSLATTPRYGVIIHREGTYKNHVDGTMWSPNVGWISFSRALAGDPPEGDETPGSPFLARFEPESNSIKGWARILSLKAEGELLDGSLGGSGLRDCYPSIDAPPAGEPDRCAWGWVRFNGTWSNTTTTTLRTQMNVGAALAEVVSSVGFPVASRLLIDAEQLTYTDKDAQNPPSFTTAAATAPHNTGASVRLATQSGQWSAGAQYMDDQQTFQFFDFAYNPAVGWIQFLPFRFIGFPYLRTQSGNIYSGSGITVPAPTPVNEYTSTYLIHANGDISEFVQFAGRTAPGASTQGGIESGATQNDPNFRSETIGSIGFPSVGSNYANILGKLDLDKLTTIVDDPASATDCLKPNGTTAMDCATINLTTCTNPGVGGNPIKICDEDGQGKNIYGTEVVARHYGGDGRFENIANHIFNATNIQLAGKVYYYPNADVFLDRDHVITNGSGSTSGAGIIVTKGMTYSYNASLNTSGITYDTASPSKISNLASLLWITTEEDIRIYPKIQSLYGSYIAGMKITRPPSAKGIFDSAYQGSATEECTEKRKLTVKGVLLAWEFKLGRTYYGLCTSQQIAEPAEVVINDGRLLSNPPPGTEDFSKALPRFQQVRP